MKRIYFGSRRSIERWGKRIEGAADRQGRVPGFEQQALSRAHVVCVGAGGLISHIAPALCRKGVGSLTILDDDVVEVSNLNRQRFYPGDVGQNKAVALVKHLSRECIDQTRLVGHGLRLQEAMEQGMDLICAVAVCGVDNNPARTAASRYFRAAGIPVIFCAVSADANHGYVFVQEQEGPCLGCVFPDMADDHRYPCPGTPAVVDILQGVGALAVYAVDTVLMSRPRTWNYRRISLADASFDTATTVPSRQGCRTLLLREDEGVPA